MYLTPRVFLLVLPLGLCSALAANLAPNPVVAQGEVDTAPYSIPPGYLDANIGKGFDSATNEVKDQCIVFNGKDSELTSVLPSNPAAKTEGQALTSEVSDVTDAEQLLTALSMNASASFGTGIYHGDLAVSLASSRSMSRFSESLLVVEQVENPHRFLKSIRRAHPTNAWLNDPFEFRRHCGDRFIIGIVTGGYFAAVVTANTSSDEQQDSIHKAFSAAAASNKLDLNSDSTYRDLVTHSDISIKILRKGPTDNVPPTIEAVRAYAESLPGKVKLASNQWSILMTTKSYGALGPPLSSPQGLFLNAAGIQYMRLKRLAAGLEYVMAHHDQFGGYDANKAIAEHDAAVQEAAELEALAHRCAKDPKECPAPVFPRPRELPARVRFIPIDPKNAFTPVVRVDAGENLVIEARGQFSFCTGLCPNASQEWTDATAESFSFHDRRTGQDTTLRANHLYRVPDYTVVSYHLVDSDYHDNQSNSHDPIEVAVFTPLYPLPPGQLY